MLAEVVSGAANTNKEVVTKMLQFDRVTLDSKTDVLRQQVRDFVADNQHH
ncbi:MAG: hypothetical protein ACI8RT_000555, partial [Candidatus Azotimanducaceae bacterium]